MLHVISALNSSETHTLSVVGSGLSPSNVLVGVIVAMVTLLVVAMAALTMALFKIQQLKRRIK